MSDETGNHQNENCSEIETFWISEKLNQSFWIELEMTLCSPQGFTLLFIFVQNYWVRPFPHQTMTHDFLVISSAATWKNLEWMTSLRSLSGEKGPTKTSDWAFRGSLFTTHNLGNKLKIQAIFQSKFMAMQHLSWVRMMKAIQKYFYRLDMTRNG